MTYSNYNTVLVSICLMYTLLINNQLRKAIMITIFHILVTYKSSNAYMLVYVSLGDWLQQIPAKT